MATTINAANIAIGFDASRLKSGMDLTRAEMATLKRNIIDSVAPVDKLRMETDALRKAFDNGAISADRFAQAQEHLKNKYTESGSSARRLIAEYVGMGVAIAGVKKSLSLAAEAESNKISLEVLTGSAEKANQLFDDFKKLDRESPLARSDFSRAAQTMIGYGVATEKTVGVLRNLSQISMGNSEKFQSLALAFGQATASGRLMGQEVNQFVNAGFNPLQSIAEKMAKQMGGLAQDYMPGLKKSMEEGAISVRMLEESISDANAQGGRFFGMNDRLLDSTSGQWSKMQSDIALMATNLGERLVPAAREFMDLMGSGSENGDVLVESAGAFSTASRLTMAALRDAYTNLDANSKGNRLEATWEKIYGRQKLMEKSEEYLHKLTDSDKEKIEASNRKRLEALQTTEATSKAEQKRRESFEKQKEQLTEQLEKLTIGKELAKEQAALRDGFSKEQAKELSRIESMIEAEKKRAKEEKERHAAEKKHQTEIERLKKEGERLADKVESPIASLERSFREAQKLFDSGNLSSENLQRARMEAAAKYQKDVNPNNVSSTIVPLLKAGSVEAYKFQMNQKDEARKVAERQLIVQERIARASEKQVEQLGNIPRMALAR